MVDFGGALAAVSLGCWDDVVSDAAFYGSDGGGGETAAAGADLGCEDGAVSKRGPVGVWGRPEHREAWRVGVGKRSARSPPGRAPGHGLRTKRCEKGPVVDSLQGRSS